MDEIKNILESWIKQPFHDTILEKDYYIDETKGRVHLIIAISVEKAFLFKTFTAVCSLNIHEIENAIDKLDEKKDELI